MRLALYQPDIPQNTATILRLGACLGVPVDVIEPCGFLFSDRRFKRAGLDYLQHAELVRHRSWNAFLEVRRAGRLILLSTAGRDRYTALRFEAEDTLLVGRESDGVPEGVARAADRTVRIPMRTGLRSLNIAIAAAMVLGEALRQTDAWPGEIHDG
ncbi:MAG: tRNA (cytidine(34)-2'-O)-methyltransferase [Alphaproteobacteria bacterium]|mgnify:CR=1 FL=1